MVRIRKAVVLGTVLVLAASVHGQADERPTGGIEQCREFTDAEARLACYDRIGEPVSGNHERTESSQEPEAEPHPSMIGAKSEDSEYGALGDDTGLPNEAEASKPILVTVSRCGEAANFNFYFYLDNGQVWRYTGAKQLRYRSCDGVAILVEDRLGFTLQMEGDSARLRVKRIK
jgi:hypothetical protein